MNITSKQIDPAKRLRAKPFFRDHPNARLESGGRRGGEGENIALRNLKLDISMGRMAANLNVCPASSQDVFPIRLSGLDCRVRRCL